MSEDLPDLVYVRVLVMRGTQPGEPARSLPRFWRAEDDGLEHATDGALGLGEDHQVEIYKLDAHHADTLVECAPHRFEVLDDAEADEALAKLGIGLRAADFFDGPPASVEATAACKASRARAQQRREGFRRRFDHGG